MAKLDSVPLFPKSLLFKGGMPTGHYMKTPDGKFQVARVVKGGGASEADYEVLFTGPDEKSARDFLDDLVRKGLNGLT